MDKRKKKEIVIISGMLLTALITILAMKFAKGGSTVCVTVSGVEYGTYNLNRNQTVEIVSENGTNTLVIEDGKARISCATCPDKICVGMHPLSVDSPGIIVCLPNEVIVELKNE